MAMPLTVRTKSAPRTRLRTDELRRRFVHDRRGADRRFVSTCLPAMRPTNCCTAATVALARDRVQRNPQGISRRVVMSEAVVLLTAALMARGPMDSPASCAGGSGRACRGGGGAPAPPPQ